MTGFLSLARDFIEHMANPRYGLGVNEEYSIRFGQLMRSEGFREQLTSEIRDVRARDTLTTHGWLWLIGWCRSNHISLSDDILHELFDEWSSVFVKAEILSVATLRGVSADGPQRYVTLKEFPHPFIRRLLVEATSQRVDDDSEAKGDSNGGSDGFGRGISRHDSRTTETLLVSLLQADTRLTIRAASTLLRHEWSGQAALLDYFWERLDSLDTATARVWKEQVDPPERLRGQA